MNIVLSFCSSAINSLLLSGADGNFPLHYNSMSWASSSEKSDMELSEEESPPPSSCSFRASSVAYLWMYSEKERRHGKRSKSSCHVHRNTHPLSHTNRSSGELCVFQITAFIKWLPNYFWEKLRNLSISIYCYTDGKSWDIYGQFGHRHSHDFWANLICYWYATQSLIPSTFF